MLEIKQIEEDDDIFVLDGVKIDAVSLEIYPASILINSAEWSQKLSDFEVWDFPETNELRFEPYYLFDEGVSIHVDLNLQKDDLDLTKVGVTIHIVPNQLIWKNRYTINEYRELVLDQLRNVTDFNFKINLIEESEMEYLGKAFLKLFKGLPIILVFTADFSQRKISEALEPYIRLIEKIHQYSVLNLLSEFKNNDVNTVFKFPEELKASCEQYLLYFAQFLQDLGINATSNLKEEAGKVLFSVTPTDDIEALDKIREALAVYLNLPASPIVYDESFAAMRLQQQIENLQHSQKMAVREIRSAERELRLAQTVIEQQDKIITQKDSIIEQQNKVIDKISSKSIMIDSLENKEELEEIFDGLKIGESKFLKEHLGIHLNPAKVIKIVVKNTFGKVDESKSVLGLDEETVKDD